MKNKKKIKILKDAILAIRAESNTIPGLKIFKIAQAAITDSEAK